MKILVDNSYQRKQVKKLITLAVILKMKKNMFFINYSDLLIFEEKNKV